MLAEDGEAWFEHGFQQAAEVRALAAAHGFTATSQADGAGHERWTVVRPAGHQ